MAWHATSDQAGGSACAFGGRTCRAGGEVVVDHAARLHQCVERCRAKEPKAPAFELARQGHGLGRRRRYLAPLRWRPASRRCSVRLEDGEKRPACFAELQDSARVPNGRFDLRPIAHDAGVFHEAFDVDWTKARDGIRVEVRERAAERLALAEDGSPGEPCLERLEAQEFEERTLVGCRKSLLRVVVLLIDGMTVPETPLHPGRSRITSAGGLSSRSPRKRVAVTGPYSSIREADLSDKFGPG